MEMGKRSGERLLLVVGVQRVHGAFSLSGRRAELEPEDAFFAQLIELGERGGADVYQALLHALHDVGQILPQGALVRHRSRHTYQEEPTTVKDVTLQDVK